MNKGKKLFAILSILLLSTVIITGCGGSKKASNNQSASQVDLELQAKVKGYSDAVEKPLIDLEELTKNLEETYHDLGYQRIGKDEGRQNLRKLLGEMSEIQNKLIEAADNNNAPEIDAVVQFFSGGIYREKTNLERVIETDLSKAELNQSLETMRDAKRQIEKGVRELNQLKQRVGLGQ